MLTGQMFLEQRAMLARFAARLHQGTGPGEVVIIDDQCSVSHLRILILFLVLIPLSGDVISNQCIGMSIWDLMDPMVSEALNFGNFSLVASQWEFRTRETKLRLMAQYFRTRLVEIVITRGGYFTIYIVLGMMPLNWKN